MKSYDIPIPNFLFMIIFQQKNLTSLSAQNDFRDLCNVPKVRLENGWNSKRMIIEGEAAILLVLETTRRAFGNQEKSKQRSTICRNNKKQF